MDQTLTGRREDDKPVRVFLSDPDDRPAHAQSLDDILKSCQTSKENMVADYLADIRKARVEFESPGHTDPPGRIHLVLPVAASRREQDERILRAAARFADFSKPLFLNRQEAIAVSRLRRLPQLAVSSIFCASLRLGLTLSTSMMTSSRSSISGTMPR